MRISLFFFLWGMMVTLFLLAGLFPGSIAQETNGVFPTNSPPNVISQENDIPVTKEQFWLAGIAAITPVVVWLAGKIASLPRNLLPVIAPVIGILFGLFLKQMELLNLPWWSSALAGSAAVGFREIINQNLTKVIKSHPEETKTNARPIDKAVAVTPAEIKTGSEYAPGGPDRL